MYEVFLRLYPYHSFLTKEGKQSVEEILKTFEMLPASAHQRADLGISEIITHETTVTATVRCDGHQSTVQVIIIQKFLLLNL
jgi:hypothetical protein